MPEKPNYPTILQLMQGAPATLEKKVLEGVIFDTPVISKLPSRVIKGIRYEQLVRTSLPLISATPYNTGVRPNNINYRTIDAKCYPYQGRVCIDKKLVHAEPEAAKRHTADLMKANVRGALASLEMAIFYGKGLDQHGTLGLNDLIGNYMTRSMTGNNKERTHGGASVWALNLKEDMLHLVWGNSRTLAFSPQKEQDVPMLTADGKPGMMPAFTWDFDFHAGLNQMDEFATARLVNESDANPLTDKALAELVNMFPSGHAPDVLVMTRATRQRLQQQRALSLSYIKKTSGSTPYADIPTDFEGLPIIVTDGLLVDETAEALAALREKTEITAEHDTNNLIR